MNLPTLPNGSILGEGPLETCKICIVGEAPGAEEVRIGRPFVGAAGRLLDQLLASAGIVRAQCYVTNVVKERPPGNDISHFVTFDKKGGHPTEAFVEYCNILEAELAACSANVVVALGKTALYALTGHTDITKRRGSLLQSSIRNSAHAELIPRKVVATIHPAAALRDYMQTYVIAYDLRRAAEESAFPELRLPERELLTAPKIDEVHEFLSEIHAKKLFSLDIEAPLSVGHITCIAFAAEPNRAMCIPFTHRGANDFYTLPEEAEIWSHIREVVTDPEVHVVMHNANFDNYFIFHRLGFQCANLEDTMVAHRILYPDLPASLAFLTSTLTREPYYKDVGKGEFKSFASNDEEFWRYNAKDAAVTIEIFPKIMKALEQQGNLATYQRRMRLLGPLAKMQERGILVDKEGLALAAQDALEHISQAEAEIKAVMGEIPPKFCGSPQQQKKYFYQTKGHKPYLKGGMPVIDDEALKRLCINHRDPVAEALRVYRRYNKRYSTYYTMTTDEQGRIHSFFDPVGADTLRISSRTDLFGTGGNLQNLTPDMKKMLLADPGYLFAVWDLKQAENRIVAVLAEDPVMLKAFEEGLDLHRMTYGMMFGVPVEKVSAEKGSCLLGNGAKSQRDWGKMFNHALNYDMGFPTFAIRTEIKQSVARGLVERYHQIYPNVRGRFHRDVIQQLRENRSVYDCYGARRVFLGRLDEGLYRRAYAHIPQSTVGTKINEEGIVFLDSNWPEAKLLNQVHDSLEFEIALDLGWTKLAEVFRALAVSLETPVPYKRPFVLPVECKIGLSRGGVEELDLYASDSPSKVPGKATVASVPELAARIEKLYNRVKEEK